MDASSSWKVEGDYFEGCNCDSVCPCIFLADPDTGDCELTIGWHVEKGNYKSTKLDGLNVVGIFYAPGNMVKGPKWKAALYVDERADTEQASALGGIFSGQSGGFLENIGALIGEVLGVKSAAITFEMDGKRRTLRIPSILSMNAEGTVGADANIPTTVTNPTLYAANGFAPVIATSTELTFGDYGMKWDNTGKNAFYSRFSYSN
jgi:hypothetical protein